MRNVCGFCSPRLPVRKLGSVAGAVILSFVATSVQAVTLSGTIQYSGSHGPVSAVKSIWVNVLESPTLDNRAGTARVTTNGGAWSIELPGAGNYYLMYWLGESAEPRVGDPIEVYLDNYSLDEPPDAVQAPQSGVALTFDDTLVVPGATGRITYTGSFPVPSGRSLTVTSFDDPQLTLQPKISNTTNGGTFSVFVFGPAGYMRAHLDIVGYNDEYDVGEPYVIYNNRSAPPGDPINPGGVLNVTFGDENAALGVHVTGTLSYSGSFGPVSASRPILIDVNTGFYDSIGRRTLATNGAAFDIALLTAGNYYLRYTWTSTTMLSS